MVRHLSVGSDPVTCLLGLIAGDSLGEEEVMRMFLEDRQTNGDFVSKVADIVLRRNGTALDVLEATTYQENAEAVGQPEDVSCANHSVNIFYTLVVLPCQA